MRSVVGLGVGAGAYVLAKLAVSDNYTFDYNSSLELVRSTGK